MLGFKTTTSVCHVVQKVALFSERGMDAALESQAWDWAKEKHEEGWPISLILTTMNKVWKMSVKEADLKAFLKVK